MNMHELVPILRQRTGCGMMDAKKALKACKGNLELALWYLDNVGLAIVQVPSFEEKLEMKLEQLSQINLLAKVLEPSDDCD